VEGAVVGGLVIGLAEELSVLVVPSPSQIGHRLRHPARHPAAAATGHLQGQSAVRSNAMASIGLINYATFMGAMIGIYGVLALGLNIQWGVTGLFNAGIAGFFAVGAYLSALLTAPPSPERIMGWELPVLVGWLGAMAGAALIAWPIGRICLRFRSDYLRSPPSAWPR